MTLRLSALVAVVVLACPVAAVAQERQTNAPPGNSAIDEYLETVPGTTGNQRPRVPGTGTPVLTPAQRSRLERLGPDGKTLADAVDATAPSRTSQLEALPDAKGRSPLGEVLDAATGNDGGGGMGIFLPLILLASLLGMIALAVLRRRSTS